MLVDVGCFGSFQLTRLNRITTQVGWCITSSINLVPSAWYANCQLSCSTACCNAELTFLSFLIRPLSDTVPLWPGSSFGAFVYIGNDGCIFAADCNTITVKIRVGFIQFPRNTKEYRKWEVSIYQIMLIPPKRNDLYDRHHKQKNLINRTVSFEKELVPLNGRIVVAIMTSTYYSYTLSCPA